MGARADPDAVLSRIFVRASSLSELPAAAPIKFEVAIGNTFC